MGSLQSHTPNTSVTFKVIQAQNRAVTMTLATPLAFVDATRKQR